MCTVILDVPELENAPVRMLAVRDEDPARAWDPPGEWWPDAHPGVIGVRDRRAGGAWLAAVGPVDETPEGHGSAADRGASRIAVLLNRGEPVASRPGVPRPGVPLASRGGIVLDAVSGRAPADPPGTAAFNLVEVSAGSASVSAWTGDALRRTDLPPGIHMLAHDGVDDPGTARIARWLPEFAALGEDALRESTRGDGAHGTGSFAHWRSRWVALLARSTELGPEDDRAIIRDNRPHGYPTLSLLVCAAEVGPEGVDLVSATLRTPGRWDSPEFGAPLALR